MADIALRFHRDMLVLSAPVLPALGRLGLDTKHDAEFSLLLEPDVFEEAYRLEAIAGAQCLVACTASLTPARLTHIKMESRAAEIAKAALDVLKPYAPQHVLVEIGPCGLPLDGTSRTSLNENLDQYARAGRLFADANFDAFFLNGFKSCVDLKCALMGLRKVSDMPIFASVDVYDDGTLSNGRDSIEEAVSTMNEFGAQVAGFATTAGQKQATALAMRIAAQTDLPLLVQIEVNAQDEPRRSSLLDETYFAPDSMAEVATSLRAVGVQFLRATGDATPAYTGALVAATMGLDVCYSTGSTSRAEGGELSEGVDVIAAGGIFLEEANAGAEEVILLEETVDNDPGDEASASDASSDGSFNRQSDPDADVANAKAEKDNMQHDGTEDDSPLADDNSLIDEVALADDGNIRDDNPEDRAAFIEQARERVIEALNDELDIDSLDVTEGSAPASDPHSSQTTADQ